MLHGDIKVVEVALAHATVVAVIQTEEMPDLLTENPLDISAEAGGVSGVEGIDPRMTMVDMAPPPAVPPTKAGIFDTGEAPPACIAIIAIKDADVGVRGFSREG